MLSKMTKPNHTTEMQAPIRAFLLREFILDSYIKESIDNEEACQGRNLRAPNILLVSMLILPLGLTCLKQVCNPEY